MAGVLQDLADRVYRVQRHPDPGPAGGVHHHLAGHLRAVPGPGYPVQHRLRHLGAGTVRLELLLRELQ